MASIWETTPRVSVEAECRRVGTGHVVANCIQILRRGDVDEETLLVLAGPSAARFFVARKAA